MDSTTTYEKVVATWDVNEDVLVVVGAVVEASGLEVEDAAEGVV